MSDLPKKKMYTELHGIAFYTDGQDGSVSVAFYSDWDALLKDAYKKDCGLTKAEFKQHLISSGDLYDYGVAQEIAIPVVIEDGVAKLTKEGFFVHFGQ